MACNVFPRGSQNNINHACLPRNHKYYVTQHPGPIFRHSLIVKDSNILDENHARLLFQDTERGSKKEESVLPSLHPTHELHDPCNGVTIGSRRTTQLNWSTPRHRICGARRTHNVVLLHWRETRPRPGSRPTNHATPTCKFVKHEQNDDWGSSKCLHE